MKIRVNGEERETAEGTTVAGLLEELAVKARGIAVDLNGEVVPRSAHRTTVLREGDAVEIVRMVGGG
ncbi:MAG TPA: sulfur carrier protein ThiS [Deltaproteobacteria bacterium]|nr:sulfur carrier protein ThiS [Deltaproteobacteria bacterium]